MKQNPNTNNVGSDSLYYQQLLKNFLSNNTYLNSFRDDSRFLPVYSDWELHSMFKPLERAIHRNPKQWTWMDNGDVRGFVNNKWFKKHLELMIEANYENYLNNIMYEYSIRGDHKVNKIKYDNKYNNKEYVYVCQFERILVDLERKIFHNNDIQNKVWLKYEKKVIDKIQKSVGKKEKIKNRLINYK